MRMRDILWVGNEKTASALAEPLNEAMVAGALEKRLDAVKRVFNAAAFAGAGLGPFVNHGRGKFEVGGNLFGRLLVKYFAEQFMRFHAGTMKNRAQIGKREIAAKRQLAGILPGSRRIFGAWTSYRSSWRKVSLAIRTEIMLMPARTMM